MTSRACASLRIASIRNVLFEEVSLLRDCFGIIFAHHVLLGEGSGVLRCAGCQVYKYCEFDPPYITFSLTLRWTGSKECQRAGWRHGDHPHRVYCKGLQLLKMVWLWDTDDNIEQKSYRENEAVKMAGSTALEKKLTELAVEVGITQEDVSKLGDIMTYWGTVYTLPKEQDVAEVD